MGQLVKQCVLDTQRLPMEKLEVAFVCASRPEVFERGQVLLGDSGEFGWIGGRALAHPGPLLPSQATGNDGRTACHWTGASTDVGVRKRWVGVAVAAGLHDPA